MSNPKPPALSLVIPLFNRPELITTTIQSIRDQAEQDWECIVVDDGSTDDSREIVAEIAEADSRVQLFKRPQSIANGPGSCRNYGLEKAGGRWVWFLDSDDCLAENALVNVFRHVDDDPIDCMVGMYDYLDQSELKRNPKCWTFDPAKAYTRHVTQACPLQTSMPLWRRSFLLEQGEKVWDPEVLYNEDYELYARLLARKPEIQVIDSVLFHYRVHDEARSVTLSCKHLDDESLNQIRYSKLDARLRVLEHCNSLAETESEKQALVQLRCRVLLQIIRDNRFIETGQLVDRFRQLLQEPGPSRSALSSLLLPLVLKTRRGLRFI